MKTKLTVAFIIVSVFGACSINAQKSASGYRVARTISLTGNGGWDYLSVDIPNNHLFVSHGTQVNVADLNTGKEIAVIPNTNGVHGIAIANDLNKAFISCGRDTSVLVVDLTGFTPVKRIKVTGQNPDAIIYDPFSKKILTFNGRSSNATVIDAISYKILATIQLSGKPEFPQTDNKGKIYVNIEDKGQVSVIDVSSFKVEKTWSIAPGEEPTGLALDDANNRLFSACSNKMMVVSDALSGKVVGTVPIGEGCDGIIYDPQDKRIYASNGEGSMTVIHQQTADKYSVIENFPTKSGARTITINRSTHKIYLSFAEREKGSPKPNSFSVLEIEKVR
jgi:DNA-binding beta-propeller fold protein YncE